MGLRSTWESSFPGVPYRHHDRASGGTALRLQSFRPRPGDAAGPRRPLRAAGAVVRPAPVEQGPGTYNMASLWVGLSVCIPTYMLAAGLVQGGMSWWQALLTILLGNLIVLVPMVLIAHPGTRFGIPFPVLARASFGTRGANVPAVLR